MLDGAELSFEPLAQGIRTAALLPDLFIELGRKHRKYQELLGSLGFALRAFDNLDHILELVPLVASQLTEADGAALVMFEPDGQLKLERLFVRETSDSIRHTLHSALHQLAAEHYRQWLSEGWQTTADLTRLMAAEDWLDGQLSQLLPPTTHLFGTPLLLRQTVRGRLYVFSHHPDYTWSESRQRSIRVVADYAAVALGNYENTQTLRQQERLAKEVATGSELQARLQPTRFPQIPGLSIAARCETASGVGGDYYDFIPIPDMRQTEVPLAHRAINHWGIVIGDVMGKGIPAGLLMMETRGVLRAEVLSQHPPAQILTHLNYVLFRDLDHSHRFVSLFYAHYCPASRRLQFSNAAHNPPLLWRAASQTTHGLDTPGMLLGLEPDSSYQEQAIHLEVGDVIVLYTDGVTDVVNQQGDRLDQEGLQAALGHAAQRYSEPQLILECLFERVSLFSSGRYVDDRTLVVIKVEA